MTLDVDPEIRRITGARHCREERGPGVFQVGAPVHSMPHRHRIGQNLSNSPPLGKRYDMPIARILAGYPADHMIRKRAEMPARINAAYQAGLPGSNAHNADHWPKMFGH